MKWFLSVCMAFVVLGSVGWADQVTAEAQRALNAQEFYFGEIDGELNPATSAAIKRFQMRNGLEVTGSLTQETLRALEVQTPVERRSGASSATGETSTREMPDLLGGERAAPGASNGASPNRPGPQPEYLGEGESEYARFFERTPYGKAPLKLQKATVRNIQAYLARFGGYREPPHGRPSLILRQSLLEYQGKVGLPKTGRGDLETLGRMGLLPGSPSSVLKRFNQAGKDERPPAVYRGVWVQ